MLLSISACLFFWSSFAFCQLTIPSRNPSDVALSSDSVTNVPPSFGFAYTQRRNSDFVKIKPTSYSDPPPSNLYKSTQRNIWQTNTVDQRHDNVTLPDTKENLPTLGYTAHNATEENSTQETDVKPQILNSTSTISSIESPHQYENAVVVPSNTSVRNKEHFYSAVFRETLVLLNDTYTLSIILPVCAGFVFASVVIVTVATCNCIRRRCFRRRMRRKLLPETLKNMRASDRAKLLADTSDDEI